MDLEILFDGFSFKASHFKSIGSDRQGFDCFRRINVIIGRNNSGKSSLIDLVQSCIHWKFSVVNDHWHAGQQTIFEMSAKISSDLAKSLFPPNTTGGDIGGNHWDFGKRLVGATVGWKYADGKGVIEAWVTDFASSDPFMSLRHEAAAAVKTRIAESIQNPFKGTTLRRLSAERDIRPESDSGSLDISDTGAGATNVIQNYLNQSRLRRSLVETDLLNALNSIFRPDGEFTRILAQQLSNGGPWEIYLEETAKGRVALSNSGSGLKTILLVLVNLILIPAAQDRKISSYVWAFEELENNLHPALLRRLLSYIAAYAREKQVIVFLTTHSSAMIDFFSRSKDAQIIHVRHDKTAASTTTIKTYIENKSLLDDLDVRASDLLQANCIIWVEGPSDRYYINRWIELWSGNLVEGTHYQCVFYGGRLLKHLEASPDDDNSGVQILRIARHACVVIDSDKRTKVDDINATKARIKAEIENMGGIAWITAGREIENYIPTDALQRLKNWSFAEKSPRQFDSVFDFLEDQEPGSGRKYQSHKPEFAEEVSQFFDRESCQGVLDLNERMAELCNFIERANGEPS
eukprot:TRINITY_DN1117_c0_g1_i1.p1 TRINITY_DN1117_c0_g1~~TRINITY_DN1117_c0_g1_i1.p1  ORF type:complete len:576 (-),score=70.14 TRINITY_DN1117_c0_g1_i1:3227-4954(-)